MTQPDPKGRTPTVVRYRGGWPTRPKPSEPPGAHRAREAGPAPAPTPVPKATPVPRDAPVPRRHAATGAASRPGWLRREAIALLGIAGAALTVLSNLAWHIPLSRPFMDVLGKWIAWNSDLWWSLYGLFDIYLHPHVQAAVALAVFLAMIGLGARISARLAGTPLGTRRPMLEGMSGPSLLIMAALMIIFLFGHDAEPSRNPLEVGGSLAAGQYVVAGTVAAGYILGDLLGQRGFHVRLYRLAVLVVLLLALNAWLLARP